MVRSYTYPFLLSMMSFFDLVRPFFSNRRLFIAGCFLNIQKSKKQFSTTIGLKRVVDTDYFFVVRKSPLRQMMSFLKQGEMYVSSAEFFHIVISLR